MNRSKIVRRPLLSLPRSRASRSLTALAVAATLVLAGCGGDEEPEKEAEPEAVESAEPEPATWPLTGLPVEGDGDGALPHPVLVTKIDNTYASSPQAGLGAADLVVEELVEGGLTRLAAFYYSELPKRVGPVRSMRASDIGIVAPVGGSMVTSGAAPQTIARIKDAGITFYQEGAAGLARDTARSAPYNVFADLGAVGKAAEIEATRPADYLPWGAAEDFPGGRKATSLVARFGSGHSTSWAFDGEHYVNDNSFAAADDQFPADTVLVLRVEVGDAGYKDPAGNPVPETKLEGRGQAMLFHDGRLVRGTWSKDALDSPLELSTRAGDLSVPAGKVWIELIPAEGGEVTFTK